MTTATLIEPARLSANEMHFVLHLLDNTLTEPARLSVDHFSLTLLSSASSGGSFYNIEKLKKIGGNLYRYYSERRIALTDHGNDKISCWKTRD